MELTKRQIQLTLMSVGIQQFIDQIKMLDGDELNKLNGAEVRDCIVEIGNDVIGQMKPSKYTINEKDEIDGNH